MCGVVPPLCLGSCLVQVMTPAARVRGAAERGEVGGDVSIPGPVPVSVQGSITLNGDSSSMTSSSTG